MILDSDKNSTLHIEIAKHNLIKMSILSKILMFVIFVIAVMNIVKYKMNLLEIDHFLFYGALLLLLLAVNAAAWYIIDLKKISISTDNYYYMDRFISLYVWSLIIGSSVFSIWSPFVMSNQLLFTLSILLGSSLFILQKKQILMPLLIAAFILIEGFYSLQVDVETMQLFGIYLAIILPICYFVSSAMSNAYKRSITFQLALIENMSSKVELTKVLSQVNRQLALQASQDALTNMPNRFAFNAYTEQLAVRAMNERLLLSTIMLDIDCFKNYNDFYGHFQGDETLKQIAQALQQIADKHGYFVSRWGGEEFSFMLINQEEDQINALCENIMMIIHSLQIEHLASPVRETVTVSMGVNTQIIRHTDDIDECIKIADEILYNVKRNGRNGYEHRKRSLVTT